jgi:hypothetical protein
LVRGSSITGSLGSPLPLPCRPPRSRGTSSPLKRIENRYRSPGFASCRAKAVVADRGEQLMMVNFGTGAVTPISRKGGGPGEYQFPASVFPGPGNETWIGDPLAGKVHVVSPDGKIPTALLPPASENGIGLSMPRGVDAAARLYFQGMPRPDAGSGAMDSVSIIRWDPKAKRVDTLGKVPSGMTVNTSGSSGNSMRVMISSKPWTAAPAWGALPDGRVAVVQPAHIAFADRKMHTVAIAIIFTFIVSIIWFFFYLILKDRE